MLGSLGHHAWKCVIGGPRIEAHAHLRHYHDKGHGWCKHDLNGAAMLCFALCCCELQVLKAFFADRQCKVPAGNHFSADSSILCRWPHTSTGGNSAKSVALPSVQGCSPEFLTTSRGSEDRKLRQPMHGGAFPDAVYLFS